ncbi:type VI secretion system baseplate subunit TssE [Azospirillum sp. B510]|uniref:type VI secretion system baseplate subunit TssE n=1 Tax=Azospirillum sp. (strain B510) TaxID=137722 RepID=UPI00030DEFB7|nr:type VI secretion system baseplate subunit TssE [Azospirillum sp. B510]
MTQSKAMNGGRTLLFERLIDFEPENPSADDPSMIVMSMTDLTASIQREIRRLLDSRAAGGRRSDIGGTVMEYGLPDFGDIHPRSFTDRRRVETAVRHAILDFEPRLLRPRIVVTPGEGNGTLTLEITGEVAAGTVVEPLIFSVNLGAAPLAPTACFAAGTG